MHKVTKPKHNSEDLEYLKILDDLKREIDTTNEELQRSEKRFKALIEKSWDVILLVDPKGKILYATPSTVRMFGRKYKEFMGLSGLKFLHPSDLPKALKAISTLILNPQEPVHLEVRVKHKDGHYIWIEIVGTNMIGVSEINAIVVNLRNINERKELEIRKDEFIALASHELKTPVTSLRLFVQSLQKHLHGIGDEQSIKSIDLINSQVNKLTELISNLLDVTKLKEGKTEFRKEAFNINNLIEEIIENFEGMESRHEIKLSAKKKYKVFADRQRVYQVLVNLINNAVKYSPDADRIKISINKKDQFALIEVRDYGIGVSKTDQKKVFDRFFQAENPDKKSFPGLGLGLYVAKTIIDGNDGKIWVKSKVGEGTSFFFTLPLAN